MISTRDLGLLPDVDGLYRAFQAMAVLDAIICPEWEYRYYSFAMESALPKRTATGSMRNGSGDDLHAIFGHVGCVIRGFGHEYPMTPYAQHPHRVFPGVLDELDSDFSDCKNAVHDDWWIDITFCVWRRYSENQWHRGKIDFPPHHDPDGSGHLLSIFDGKPKTYASWAEGYFSRPIPLGIVRHIFCAQTAQ